MKLKLVKILCNLQNYKTKYFLHNCYLKRFCLKNIMPYKKLSFMSSDLATVRLLYQFLSHLTEVVSNDKDKKKRYMSETKK